MRGSEVRQTVRDAVRAYEQALDPVRRKELGQFFSGVPLGKLLAHLSLRPDTRTVLDPMAGHGDLLDAVWEASTERSIPLERVDGIEIDNATAATCRERLAAILGDNDRPESVVLAANAFDPATVNALPTRSYDLVITNPPYVRYQGRTGKGGVDSTRSGLETIVDSISTGMGRTIWQSLAQNYSGQADLSVPAWILAGFMVRPGGRLALVVPATWRSRDYADVIRYLVLRCFALETIVADTQPGWFSDALVRTHLVVARRLTDEEVRQPLSAKNHWSAARWVHVSPDATDERSLVGAAFASVYPEAALAASLHDASQDTAPGIEIRDFDLRHEWAVLQSRISRHRWHSILEGGTHNLPLFSARHKSILWTLPDALRQMLPRGVQPAELVMLEEAGIKVGQGLRTGCNGFFYVTVRGEGTSGTVPVQASAALGGGVFAVPSSALRPALRRQSEIALIEQGGLPPGRVLDLRGWVLPEDEQHVTKARAAYRLCGDTPPRLMLPELAAFVRRAASVSLDGPSAGKRIPEFSAVRTNVREPDGNKLTPRFWYMLPEFAPRHLPAAFVPRINHNTPWIECNIDPPLLIDANFSTFWTLQGGWSPFAMKALLNSVWCRAYMEVAGTPLGGGALKLEATHLRWMPVPLLTRDARAALHAAGQCLRRDAQDIQTQIDHTVLQALFPSNASRTMLSDLAAHIAVQTSVLCAARQRVVS